MLRQNTSAKMDHANDSLENQAKTATNTAKSATNIFCVSLQDGI